MRQFWRWFKIEFFAAIGALLLAALSRTLRWHIYENAADRNVLRNGVPKIFVFWHSRQLLMPFLYKKLGGERGKICTLISRHHDGRMIARVVSYWGIDSVAGSSSRGGSVALRALSRKLAAGTHVAITPDGPRGPVGKVKPGALALAESCGTPIIPAAYGATKKWIFGSWDRMILPKPFSKVVIVLGEALSVPRGASVDELSRYALQLEERLAQVTQTADRFQF